MVDRVAPVALAGIGYWIGGPIGGSIGWMIGSWLFSKQAKDKNQILDPGAQELPRPNQALRGTTLPVLFGTNRVSSQIVWQNNFQTIRSETTESGGGGKLGGSGGGKSGGAGGGSISYAYKIDIIYHFGMVPEAYNLFGGWVGKDRLNDTTIAAIGQQFSSDQLIFNSNTSYARNASLQFDDSVYFPGNHPEDNQWSYFSGVIGAAVRWPTTAWIGFKALNLGGTPTIPQLSVEIGPGAVDIDFDSGYIGKGSSQTLTVNGCTTQGASKADNGKLYIASPTEGNHCADIFCLTDGAITDRISDADLDAAATAVGLDPTSAHSFNDENAGINIPGTKYMLMWGVDITTNRVAFVLYDINNDGTLNPIGGFRSRISGLTLIFLGAPKGLAITNQGTDDDPILFWRVFSGNMIFITLPSINEMKDTFIEDTSGIFNTRAIDVQPIIGESFGSATSYRPYASFGWIVPKATIEMDATITWGTRIYFYVSKADCQWHLDNPGSGNSYIETQAATYSNGFMAYWDVGQVTDNTPVNITTTPIIANGDFTDQQLQVMVPFDDACENKDGTEDLNDDYMPQPSVLILTQGQVQNASLVCFGKPFTGSEDSTTGTWSKCRAFIYNPLSGKYTQYASAEGSSFDTVADAGALSGNRYSYNTQTMLFCFDEATQILYEYRFLNATVVEDNFDFHNFSSQFGIMSIGGGDDATPPYIIKQILVNPFFGVYPGQDLIDDTTYQAVNLYCLAQGFVVSTQYRREEAWEQIVELLLAIYGGYIIFSGGKFKFGFSGASGVEGAGDSVRTIDNHRLLIKKDGDAPVNISKGAQQDTYNKVKVNYIDRSLDYAQNQVEENDEVDQDLTGIRTREFPPQFVMAGNIAKLIAIRGLWTNLYSRDSYSFYLGRKDSDLEPGDVITLVDSFHPELSAGQKCRIVRWKEEAPGVFAVQGQQEIDLYLTSVTSAFSTSNPSSFAIVGPAAPALFQQAYELPQEYQGASGKVYIGWAPSKYSFGAKLYVSADNISYAPALDVQPYPIAGRILTDLGSDLRRPFEENFEVALFPSSNWTVNSPFYEFDETLNEVGIEAMHFGAGLMWVGSEMLAYQGVNLVAQNHYRFNRVYRGWGGTNIQDHSSGAYFFRHGGGIFGKTYNEDKIGTTFYYKVVPYNIVGAEYDVASVDASSYTIQGGYYKPQVPSAIQYVDSAGVAQRGFKRFNVQTTADIAVSWKDTARQNGFGAGGFGQGVGGYGRFTTDTLSHAWAVTVVGSGDVIVRSTTVDTGYYSYPQSVNAADNGAWRGNVAIAITPFGTYGDAPRTSVISLELFQ